MSTSFSVLLAFLALLACHGHEAAVLERSIFLKESIRLLGEILSTQVSCDKANVTNVFAGNEVRRERRLESCDSAIGGGGRGSPRGLKPSRAHAGRAWGRDVPVLPAPARHRGGGTRPPPSACPPRALSQSMGTKRWRWHRSPSAWPISKNAVCIFFQTGTDMELLCKASTVVFESLSCHKPLKGIYLNLLHIVTKSTSLKAPCPVAAGNTTSLQEFLRGLHRTLQRVAKENL
nr:uncharacterized protein LOC101801081 [Anas platyrhynchos]